MNPTDVNGPDMNGSDTNASDNDKDLEFQLRDVLRPVAPSEAFTEALVAQLNVRNSKEPRRRPAAGRAEEPPEERGQAAGPALPRTRDSERGVRRARRLSGWWVTASLAASLLVAVGVVQHLRAVQERERGFEARREVIEALRVTNQKLDLAYRVVRSQSSALADGDSGV
jgi:hypothetical protein